MRIAIFGNESNTTSGFFNASCFTVWEKLAEGWKETQKTDFKAIVPTNPAQTRKDTEALLPLIADCEIVAGGGLTGIPYVVFDNAGKHIFQIDEVSPDILDSIISDVEDAESSEPEPEPHTCKQSGCNVQCSQSAATKIFAPTETSSGIYNFDLIALQRANSGVSSKQALQKFMETTEFSELHLKCKHLPPWIESNYTVREVNEKEDSLNVIITKGA